MGKEKKLRQEQKEIHNQELHDKIDEVESSSKGSFTPLFNWYDYLIMVVLTAIIIGISLLIGYFVFTKPSRSSWVMYSFSFVGFLIYLILGFVRNRHAIAFWNDTRMRYRKTHTPFERIINRIRYIILIPAAVILITAVILSFTI
jgi:hypothetical protein